MHRALRAEPQDIQRSIWRHQFKSVLYLAVVFDNPAHLLQCLAIPPRDTPSAMTGDSQ